MAIALVVGQAALCLVIGWLTFGPGPGVSQAGKAVDPAAAAPPAVMPTASIGQPAAPMPLPPPGSSSSAAATPSRRTSSPPTVRRSTPPAESKGRTVAKPDDEVAPIPAGPTGPVNPKPPENVVTTSTPNPGEVQGSVAEGDVCEPEGADGLTDDDELLRCVKNAAGELRWQTV